MLSDLQVKDNLTYYIAQYNMSFTNQRAMLLYSKASILEVCGWTEEAMDKLVLDSATRCRLSSARISDIEKKYIQNTYGFTYKKHFEKMIVSVLGYQVLQVAENNCVQFLPSMHASLNELTPLRGYYAHTHFDLTSPYPGTRTNIPTPSIMQSHLNNIQLGLTELESELKNLNC
jgi:hypothetical protein